MLRLSLLVRDRGKELSALTLEREHINAIDFRRVFSGDEVHPLFADGARKRVLRESGLLPWFALPSHWSCYFNPTRRRMLTSRGTSTPSTKMTIATSLFIGVRPMM